MKTSALFKPGLEAACSRRGFVAGSLVGVLGLTTLGRTARALPRMAPPPVGKAVVEEKFADVIQLGDGVWAVNSKWGSTMTMSNGGIVAGEGAVAVIEGYNTPAGAAWVAETAKTLTGRYPTHIIVTHFHPDHTDGLSGYMRSGEAPRIICTKKTRDLLVDRYKSGAAGLAGGPAAAPAGFTATPGPYVVPNTVISDSSKPTELDLGGKVLGLTELSGHTPSDLVVRLDSAHVVWGGDLLFNNIFPYYGDALPAKLRDNSRALLSDEQAMFVPGHGGLSDAAGLKPYLALLDEIERAARESIKAGQTPEEGAKSYKVPDNLKRFALWNPTLVQLAFAAWKRDLDNGGK